MAKEQEMILHCSPLVPENTQPQELLPNLNFRAMVTSIALASSGLSQNHLGLNMTCLYCYLGFHIFLSCFLGISER